MNVKDGEMMKNLPPADSLRSGKVAWKTRIGATLLMRKWNSKSGGLSAATGLHCPLMSPIAMTTSDECHVSIGGGPTAYKCTSFDEALCLHDLI